MKTVMKGLKKGLIVSKSDIVSISATIVLLVLCGISLVVSLMGYTTVLLSLFN